MEAVGQEVGVIEESVAASAGDDVPPSAAVAVSQVSMYVRMYVYVCMYGHHI